jgi:hydroxymethylglutaryl-CoA reductase
MGANFINSCLEEFAMILKDWIAGHPSFSDEEKKVHIIMSILSNYTPDCIVRSWVECPIADLGMFENGLPPEEFAWKFQKAVKVAEVDVHRATTHNKGIYNGIDAVVLATGNDFRAVEACGHAYASRNGRYTSLSEVSIQDGIFRFSLTVPMALGVVGGLTSLHPLVKRGMELLGNPSANELMMIAATMGLANNFGALKSLTTTGIQKGHMKMHLLNILNHFSATDAEKNVAIEFFKTNKVSFNSVREFLESQRNISSSVE